MTKRKPKTASAVIHAHGGPADDFNMALLEINFIPLQPKQFGGADTGKSCERKIKLIKRF